MLNHRENITPAQNVPDMRDLLAVLEPFLSEFRKLMGNPSLQEIKEDGTPVTQLERRLEVHLRATIARCSSDIVIVSEELVNEFPVSLDEFRAASVIVAIDPNDGTQNFLRGFPLFGTSLGVLRREGASLLPESGLIAMPALGFALFTAPEGVVRRDLTTGDEALVIPSNRALSQDEIILLSQSFYSTFEASKLRWSAVTPSPRTSGSTVADLAFTATGTSVATITGAHIWDIAAGLALCARLGMEVWRAKNAEVVRGFRDSDFIIEGTAGRWLLTDYLVVSSEKNRRALHELIRQKEIDFGQLLSSTRLPNAHSTSSE